MDPSISRRIPHIAFALKADPAKMLAHNAKVEGDLAYTPPQIATRPRYGTACQGIQRYSDVVWSLKRAENSPLVAETDVVASSEGALQTHLSYCLEIFSIVRTPPT